MSHCQGPQCCPGIQVIKVVYVCSGLLSNAARCAVRHPNRQRSSLTSWRRSMSLYLLPSAPLTGSKRIRVISGGDPSSGSPSNRHSSGIQIPPTWLPNLQVRLWLQSSSMSSCRQTTTSPTITNFDYVYNPPTRNKIKTGNRSSLLDIKHANEIVPTIHADKDLQTSKDQDTVEHQQQTMYHQSTIQSKNSRSSLHQPSCQPTQFTNHMFCYIFSVDVPCCTTVLYMCSMPYFFLFSPLQIHLSVPLFGANRVLDDSDFTCEKIFDTRINEQSHSHTAQIRCTTTVTNFCFISYPSLSVFVCACFLFSVLCCLTRQIEPTGTVLKQSSGQPLSTSYLSSPLFLTISKSSHRS